MSTPSGDVSVIHVHHATRVPSGDTEAKVKETYSGKGTYTVEPHPYTGPKGHYLIFDADGKGGKLLIFETDGSKVTMFRAGDEGAVRAIEGCA